MPVDVLVGVVALLEHCAQRRAGMVVMADDPLQTRRMLQAEAAGRELMALLVRPGGGEEWSLANQVRRVVGYVQTVIAASLSNSDVAPLIMVRGQHIVADPTTTRLICHAAVLLLLAALDDDALDIDLRLASVPEGVWLTIESSRPGITVQSQPLRDLHRVVLACGGHWETECPSHGGSWLVHVTVPCKAAVAGEDIYG